MSKTTKRVATYEEACKKLGKDPKAKVSAHDKLEIIAAAIKGNFKPDYSKPNQKKWFPIFRFNASSGAFRFGVSGYVCAIAGAGCGARLAVESESDADYFGEQFIKEWNDYLIV